MALSYRLSTVLVCKGPLFFSFAAQILVGKSCLAYLKFYVTFTELVALITQKLAACGGETVCFLAPKIWISSINHQNLLMRTVWKHKRLNRAESRPLYVRSCFSHIHSKTACRGFESFCPCQRHGPEFLGIPGFSRVLGWWYTVWIAAPLGVYFAVFSYLFASVSNFSVWHIINKSSKKQGFLLCAGLFSLKIEPVCYPLQAGCVFFDVVHLGYL